MSFMYGLLHCFIVYINCLLCYLLVDNWMLVDRDDIRCIGDCQNGTLTERYRCESVSCQGINNYFSPALNGELEVVKRKGLCNQQTVCQKCRTSKSCQLDIGKDYNGCDLDEFREFVVPSWQMCAVICSSIAQCKFWTWAHQNSSVKPFYCFLKKNKCNTTNSTNFISGEKNCIKLSTTSACPPRNGSEYQGCSLMTKTDVTSFEKCSKICFATQGCKFWTWYHLSNTCCLKKQSCGQIGSPYAISGDISTYFLSSCG